jgi:hypothetical protein
MKLSVNSAPEYVRPGAALQPPFALEATLQ